MQGQIKWQDNYRDYLKKSDLVEGLVYVFKDGRLALYVGRTSWDSKFVFYILGNVPLVGTGSWDMVLMHPAVSDKMLRTLADVVIKQEMFDPNCLHILTTMPKLLGTYPGMDYRDVYRRQYLKWGMLGKDTVPELMEPRKTGTKDTKPNCLVSAKDLKSGVFYHTGEDSWRKTYLFLGRYHESGKNTFVWSFYGGNNEDVDNMSLRDLHYYLSGADQTKSNKKVRPVREIKRRLTEQEVRALCFWDGLEYVG